MCKVSVIVPVHNSSMTLNKCVDSILNQTYTNLEVVLIENGSEDSSLQICENYAAQDVRVKVYSINKKGISKARNAGLDYKTGEYFTFVDSDDFLQPEMIEKLLNESKNTHSDMTFCRVNNIKSDGECFVSPERQFENTLNNRVIKYFFMSGTDDYFRNVIWRILYKTSVFKGLRFDEIMVCGEDSDFLFRAFAISVKNSYVSEPLYNYSYFYDKPEIQYKKYYRDMSVLLRTYERLAISCVNFCEQFNEVDFSKAVVYSKYLELVSISLNSPDYRKKITLLCKDGFWRTANTGKNYKAYKQYFYSYSKLKIFLIKNKMFTLCRFLMKVKKLIRGK